MNLFEKIQRIANEVPETRPVLVPLLRKFAGTTLSKQASNRIASEVDQVLAQITKLAKPSYENYLERKRKENKKPLSREQWEARILNTGPVNQTKDKAPSEKKDEGGKGDKEKKDEGGKGSGGKSLKKVFTEALSIPGLGDLTSGMPKEFLGKNEGYSHPAVKKLQTKLLNKLDSEQIKTLVNDVGQAHSKMMEWLSKQPDIPSRLPQDVQDAHAQLTSVWRAVRSLDPSKAEGKKKDAPKTKSYKKSYPKPAAAVMDKHNLTDDDAEQVKKFKGDKPRSGVKLSPAEIMQKFLAKAKPETKERMKGMSPADFIKLLGALTDDGAEG